MDINPSLDQCKTIDLTKVINFPIQPSRAKVQGDDRDKIISILLIYDRPFSWTMWDYIQAEYS